MNKGFSAFLKLLACLAFFLSVFPFLAFKASAFSQSDLQPVYDIVLSCVVGFIGLCIGIFTEKTSRNRPVLFKILCIPMLAVPVGLSALMSYLFGQSIKTPEFFILTALVSFDFIVGIFIAPKDYKNTLGKMFLGMNIVTFLIMRFLESFTEAGGNTMRSVIVLTIVLAAVSVINNQANIDALMERRRYDKKSLPKRIRYFNLSLLFVFFAIVLLLMIFRKQIGDFFVFVRNLIVQLVIDIFEFFAWLRDLLMREGTSEMLGENEKDMIFTQAGNSIIDEIFSIVFYAVVIFLIIKYHKQILTSVKKTIVAIARAISTFLKKTASARIPLGDGYYEDTEEYIDPSYVGAKDTVEREKKKRYNRMYRKYKHTSESSEKLRLGYALAVVAMRERDERIKSSDTPLEICDMFKDVFGEELILTTDSYNLVRYDGRDFDGDFTALDTLLKKLEY